MVSPARRFDASACEDRVLTEVRELLSELGHASALRSAGPASHLDRDLGLGSLERVELLLRLEKSFGTRLDEEVLAGAETVQDLIFAVAAANGAQANTGVRTETSVSAARGISTDLAEGIPAAETFQEVLRQRGRADASRAHLIFYEEEGESAALTFGQLFEGAERVAADLAKRGIGRGDTVALMLPTSRDFFLTFAGTLLAGATPVPIYPPFRADRICRICGAAVGDSRERRRAPAGHIPRSSERGQTAEAAGTDLRRSGDRRRTDAIGRPGAARTASASRARRTWRCCNTRRARPATPRA